MLVGDAVRITQLEGEDAHNGVEVGSVYKVCRVDEDGDIYVALPTNGNYYLSATQIQIELGTTNKQMRGTSEMNKITLVAAKMKRGTQYNQAPVQEIELPNLAILTRKFDGDNDIKLDLQDEYLDTTQAKQLIAALQGMIKNIKQFPDAPAE